MGGLGDEGKRQGLGILGVCFFGGPELSKVGGFRRRCFPGVQRRLLLAVFVCFESFLMRPFAFCFCDLLDFVCSHE